MDSRDQAFTVGAFLVEPGLNRLARGSQQVTVRPQVMDTLVYLAQRPGQVVTADELMDHVWGDVVVGSGSVYNCINELRKVFQDDPQQPRYIETISKRGYRMVAPIGAAQTPAAARPGWKVPALLVLLAAAAVLWWQPWQSGTSPAKAPPSIAVLPFADLSPGGDQGYFADGIAEALIDSLAGVEGLQVAARTSSFHFRDKQPTVGEVAAALGVAFVVEGSVRTTEDRVRITAQLIAVEDGFHLWSQTYERGQEDIFAIQDEISSAIVKALLDKLALEAPPETPRPDTPVRFEAYSEFLVGLQLLNRRTPESMEAAIPHFEKAVELAPGYAPAHANLAIAYHLLHYYDRLTAREAWRLGRAASARALELDSLNAQAHASAYFMEDLQNIHDPQLTHLDRAVTLNPSYADALNWKALELDSWRRYAEADATLRRALQIDPLSVVVNSHQVARLLRAGRRNEAMEVAERLTALDIGWGLRRVGSVDFDAGDYAGAVAHYLEGLASAPRHFALRKELSRLFSELGLATEAARLYPSDRVAWYNHLYAGEWNSAIAAAEAALAAGGDERFFTPALAEARYFAGDFEGAAAGYEALLPLEFSPDFQPEVMGRFGLVYFAMALREIGDVAGSGVILRGAEDDVARQREAGYSDGDFHQLHAMTLAARDRADEAMNALEAAFEAGYREGRVLAAPLFEALRDLPRFEALEVRYQAAKAENLAAVLDLICSQDLPQFGWQPLLESCDAGVTLGSIDL